MRIAQQTDDCGSTSALGLSVDQISRFWEQVDKTSSPLGCWLWTGHTHYRDNYGQLKLNGKHYKAHRVAWVLEHGPIPAGLWVLHTCESDYPPGDTTCRRCVRHLYLGDVRDNARDMVTAGRQGRHDRSGENNGRARLTHKQVCEIRSIFARGDATKKELAQLHHVAVSTVYDIVSGKKWAS